MHASFFLFVFFFSEKPVFTIGSGPVINDLDNFSEVSLDRDGNSEVGTGPFYSNPLAELDSYANLQNLQEAPSAEFDINSNDKQNDQQVDTITALGSAASTVFSQFSSTFSNIIKGSTSQSKMDEFQNQNLTQPPSAASNFNDNSNINNNFANYGFPMEQPDQNLPPPVTNSSLI